MALIPPERLTDWEPGVVIGVLGGIPTNRTTLIDVTEAPYNADNTGATDARSAIQDAIDAATTGEVVYLPTGTYRVDSVLTIGQGKDNITIRGDGPTLTTIDFRGAGGIAIQLGTGYTWNWPSSAGQAITGGLTLGSESITMADTSNFTVGVLMKIGQEGLTDNTAIQGGATPICSVVGFNLATQNPSLNQVVRIISKDASSVTFFPPIIRENDAGLDATATNGQWTNDGMSVEDLTIDGANTTMYSGVSVNQCFGAWIKNVRVLNTSNYHVTFEGCVNCEVRHCTFDTRIGGGSNGSGILCNTTSSCLFEDNIVLDIFPTVEVNGGSCGNVFGYNTFENTPVGGFIFFAIDTNHAPHNHHNLFEGNVTPNVTSDGYFGGESEVTVYRNWMHASCFDSSEITYAHAFKRFTRNASLAGNVVGKTGVSQGLFNYGGPNIGNGDSLGTAEPTTGDFWSDWKSTATLTTRSSDTAGTITLASGALHSAYYAGSYVITLRWGGGTNSHQLIVTASSDPQTVISWTGGTGTVLPAQDTEVEVFFGNAGYQEIDLDVENTTIDRGNYMYGASGAAGSMSSLDGETLVDSFYTTKAQMVSRGVIWGDLTFPPFDPTAPNGSDYENIPSGYRFVNGDDPPSGGGGTTITVANVTNFNIL